MCDAELLADTRLLVPFTAKVDAVAPDTSQIVEVVTVEPVQGSLLNLTTTFRDKEDPVTEPLLHELMQSLENAGHRRGLQVIAREERGISPIVHSVNNDASDIDAKYFYLQFVLLNWD